MSKANLLRAIEREDEISWEILSKSNPVLVEHLDGSKFLFQHAIIEKHDNMIWVFSEHNSTMVFYVEDLDQYGYISNNNKIEDETEN